MNELTTAPVADAPASQNLSLMMLNHETMRSLMDFSELMANSTVTVPKHLQGKPADCMAIAMQAAQWGMNPFAVAQKTHLVNGTLGYEAQLVNAVIQNSKAIVGSFHYEFDGTGPNIRCRVGAVIRGQQDITWGEWLCAADVQTKNSPLWKVNPRQQLGYLQVKNWARLYAPGAILGVYTSDELEVLPAQPGAPRDLPRAEEVPSGKPGLESYPQDRFEANLPEWRGVVESGRKTAAQLIEMLCTRAVLSHEQKETIRAFENFTPAAEVEGAAQEG